MPRSFKDVTVFLWHFKKNVHEKSTIDGSFMGSLIFSLIASSAFSFSSNWCSFNVVYTDILSLLIPSEYFYSDSSLRNFPVLKFAHFLFFIFLYTIFSFWKSVSQILILFSLDFKYFKKVISMFLFLCAVFLDIACSEFEFTNFSFSCV